MSGRYLLCFTFLLLSTVCLADHHFICTANSVCAGETIYCNCTSDNDTDSLMWSVRNSAGAEVGSSGWLDSTNNQSTIRIRDATFMFFYNSTTLSMGNISTSPGINNYSLVCSFMAENDTDDSQYPSFNISSVTSLQNPGFRIRFENFTGSLVTANWTDSDDYCLESYVLNVTRDGGPPMSYSTQDSSVVLTNISSTIDYGFTVIPVGMYLPRNDLASDPRTIRFDIPVAVTNLRAMHMNIPADTPDGTPINVTIRWNPGQSNPMRPRTRYYYIMHNATRHLETTSSGSGSGAMSDDTFTPSVFVERQRMAQMQNNYQRLRGAVVGETYFVSVKPENPLGNGTAVNLTFTLTYMPPQPTSTSSVMLATSTATPEPSMSPTTTEESDALPTWAIAVIAVGGGIILAAIVIVIIVIVCCCVCRAAAKKEEEHEMHGTKL